MADDNKRRSNLGRGLSALFGDVARQDPAPPVPVQAGPVARQKLPIEFLCPGKFQPRRRFGEAEIQGLVDSIRERGILQPLLVRRIAADTQTYEIIAGERRWRAAQKAGLHEVPVVIGDFTDREALEIALIENIQRQDLTALEEAEGYRRLLEEFNHTQEDLARTVGKSRSHVANMLRLLALPEAIRQMVEDGELTAGHARALLTADDPVTLAHEVIRRGLNVRQTEQLVRDMAARKAEPPAGRPAKDPDLLALERDLSTRTGLRVTIRSHAKGGSLNLHYQSLDELDDVLRLLSRQD